jgi:polynucleotide 5'-hydroxyl-kinase GRC3/NOL9
MLLHKNFTRTTPGFRLVADRTLLARNITVSAQRLHPPRIMAQKRKAKDAFGKIPPPQLSAFAAARAQQPQPAVNASLHTSVEATKRQKQQTQNEVQPGSLQSKNAAVATTRPKPVDSSVAYQVLREDDNVLEIGLKANESAVFAGEYDVEVVKGVVDVHGAIMLPRSGPQRVYAISAHALPVILSRAEETVVRIISVGSQLQALEKYSPLFRNIWATATSSSGAAREGARIRSFAAVSSTKTDDDAPSRAASVNALNIAPETRKLLSSINGKIDSVEYSRRPIRIMTIGPKSSGKSTLSRALVNAILTRPNNASRSLYYLDLDPGQPEFGPPGQLSLIEVSAPLLGPSFSHLATSPQAGKAAYRVLRSHSLAAMTFRDFPGHYIDCAVDLATHIPQDSGNTPLVVNSCGWLSGVGASALMDLCSALHLTDLSVLGPLEDGLRAALAERVEIVHQLPRLSGKPSIRSPAELRAMQMMAYFHQRQTSQHIQNSSNQNLRSSTTATGTSAEPKFQDRPISSFRPWTVQYSGPNSGIAAIVSYSQPVAPPFLSEVLNGAIVAIVVPDDSSALASASASELDAEMGIAYTEQESIPYIPFDRNQASPPAPLDPRQTSCVGLALIRSIDPVAKTFDLITPLSEAAVAELHRTKRKVMLVRGGFDSPDWAYLEDGNSSSERRGQRSRVRFGREGGARERPWVSFKEPVGVEGSVWRLRHPPTAAALAGGSKGGDAR